MTKSAFEFTLHQFFVNRNLYTEHCYRYFLDYPNLTFEEPDKQTFRNLSLAFDAMKKQGNMPCVLIAAIEIAVDAFLHDKIGFLNMSDLIAECMEKITFVPRPKLEDYISTNIATRELANKLL